MQLEWKCSAEEVKWSELAELYKIAPLGDKNPADLEKAFCASLYKCFVYQSGALVGAGRVLADGVDCACICDLAVHPRHQGCGLGGAIVSELVKRSAGHDKILLYATPGKEPFYQKYGFKPMTTAMAIFKNQQQAWKEGLIEKN